jgi:phosphopantetheine binding protein
LSTPDPADAWRDFAAEVAEAAGVAEARITPDARLVEDLALDSLSLAEVVVMVIERYDPLAFLQQLGDRTWEGVTVGQLFDECMREVRGGRAGVDRMPGE